MGEEKKSQVLLVPSSGEFGKHKVNNKIPLYPTSWNGSQYILPATVNVAHTRSCCTTGNTYLLGVAFTVSQRNKLNHHFRDFFFVLLQRSCSVSLDCEPHKAAGLQKFYF